MEQLQCDDLTGAIARAHLAPALATLRNHHATTGAHHSLAILDLDHLKALNDVYGHATGDAALAAVAERALKVLRGHDQLFRYGGDEFVVLLPNTTLSEAETVLRRVHDQVTANPVETAVWVTINVSVGIAATNEDGEKDLFERADRRMRVAKRGGRNVVLAQDQELRPGGELGEARLVARDAQLAAFDSFLAAEAPRVLRVAAENGAGVTRFLSELAVRARQAGRAVRALPPQRARRDMHLWALESAYAGDMQGEPVEDDMRMLLRNDAEAHGLLLLVPSGRWLDPASASLVAERLRRGGTKLVEVVSGGADGAFAADEQVALGPLREVEMVAWLSAALGGPLPLTVTAELWAVGGGLPGVVARMVSRLVQDGLLWRADGSWHAETIEVRRSLKVSSRSRERPLASVPNSDTPLIGRRAWLQSAVVAAREQGLVVLVGAGGTGKSRLAAQLALDLAEDPHGGADDGTFWVDLTAVDSAAALPGLMAEAMGFEQVDDVGTLVERLRGLRVRLVLDNADSVADGAGILSRLLERSPGLRLLITARMPLRLARERVLAVPELSPAAARELFRQGMRRVGSAYEVEEEGLDEVLERVGLQPLALVLAAAWTRILAPGELVDQLDHRPESLVHAPGSQPLTTRFIDVARDLMSEREQQTFGALTLIPGGFTAEDGRAATGASSFFLLASLERSLLRREGERYTVQAAIAERFRAGLANADAAKDRVARAYSELARRLNEMPSDERTEHGFKRADAERANLEFALVRLASTGDAEALWPLVRLMRGYLDVRGRARRGLELFKEVDEALVGHPDPELRAWVRECVGLFHFQRSEPGEAGRCVAYALALLEPGGPNVTYGMVLNTAGMLAASGTDFGEAFEYFEASARMRADLGDRFGEAQARGNVALVLAALDRHDEAFAALEEARRRYAEVKHYSGLSLSLAAMSRLAHTERLLEPEAALALAREGQELGERIGYAYGARLSATEVGNILAGLGRREEAAAAYERAGYWARVEELPDLELEYQQLAEQARNEGEAALAQEPLPG